MILTLTLNPSIDRTASIPEPLNRGGVYRLSDAIDVAGGKGVNVSGAVAHAGVRTLALFPVSGTGRFRRLVEDYGLDHEPIHIDEEARVNLTIVEDDGTTTKLNTPGAELSEDIIRACLDRLAHYAPEATWVVLAGSLPRGVPDDIYLRAATTVREINPDCKVAVDTSGGPLEAIGAALAQTPDGINPFPDLMKPNGLELGQLAGIDGQALEDLAEDGDYDGIIDAARKVNEAGVPELLITLGAAGAILSRDDGLVLHASSPKIEPLSTVGAGDSALAGYILAEQDGEGPEQRTARAVAYGSAATALPGTTAPKPEQAHPEQSVVTILRQPEQR